MRTRNRHRKIPRFFGFESERVERQHDGYLCGVAHAEVCRECRVLVLRAVSEIRTRKTRKMYQVADAAVYVDLRAKARDIAVLVFGAVIICSKRQGEHEQDHFFFFRSSDLKNAKLKRVLALCACE